MYVYYVVLGAHWLECRAHNRKVMGLKLGWVNVHAGDSIPTLGVNTNLSLYPV